ncbi:hypothetical protein Tco_1486138 [Tanacetum coccineum]
MGYGITDVWEDPIEAIEDVPLTTVAELSQRVTDLVTTVRQDIDEIYMRFKDAQDDRPLLRGQVNMLQRDRHYHLNTTMLVESEARVARDAWAQSMGYSRAKMPLRKGTRTRTTPATATATTLMTDAAIRALIAQGVADALAE